MSRIFYGSIIVAILIVNSQFYYVNAAVAILPPQEKPAEFAGQEGCYVPELKKVLGFNKPFSPQDGKSCLQYTCGTDGYTDIFSCGAIGFPEECSRVPGNRYLPYPKCCDSVSCPTTTTTTTEKPKPKPNPCISYPPPKYSIPEKPDTVEAEPVEPVDVDPVESVEPVDVDPVESVEPEGPVQPAESVSTAKATSTSTTTTVSTMPAYNPPPRCPPGMGCIGDPTPVEQISK